MTLPSCFSPFGAGSYCGVGWTPCDAVVKILLYFSRQMHNPAGLDGAQAPTGALNGVLLLPLVAGPSCSLGPASSLLPHFWQFLSGAQLSCHIISFSLFAATEGLLGLCKTGHVIRYLCVSASIPRIKAFCEHSTTMKLILPTTYSNLISNPDSILYNTCKLPGS